MRANVDYDNENISRPQYIYEPPLETVLRRHHTHTI